MPNISVTFVQPAIVGTTSYIVGQTAALPEADARYAIVSRFAITTPRVPVATPTEVKRLLAKKADLVAGKVPTSELPTTNGGAGLTVVFNDDGTATIS